MKKIYKIILLMYLLNLLFIPCILAEDKIILKKPLEGEDGVKTEVTIKYKGDETSGRPVTLYKAVVVSDDGEPYEGVTPAISYRYSDYSDLSFVEDADNAQSECFFVNPAEILGESGDYDKIILRVQFPYSKLYVASTALRSGVNIYYLNNNGEYIGIGDSNDPGEQDLVYITTGKDTTVNGENAVYYVCFKIQTIAQMISESARIKPDNVDSERIILKIRLYRRKRRNS